jgi:nucleotide-binding universal stress UspA family protein
MLQAMHDMLGQETERLRQSGVTVHAELLKGVPDEAIVAQAQAMKARLVVVAALGYRSEGLRSRSEGWGLGSVAARIAQTTPVPALIVRRAEAFQAWVRHARPLRILVAADFSAPSAAAIHWVGQLRQCAIAPCDVVVTHVSRAPEAGQHRERQGPMEGERMDPEVERTLTRDLTAQVGELPGEGTVQVQIRSGRGPIAAQVVQLAEEARMDLVVVGTHQRSGLGRWWYGSVSQGVLYAASMSVACVPVVAAGEPNLQQSNTL